MKKKAPIEPDAFGNRVPEDTGMLWIGAFRYYCGRQSYAVSWFCEILIREWEVLPVQAQEIIRRDLEKSFQRDDIARDTGVEHRELGADMDRKEWEKVRALWK